MTNPYMQVPHRYSDILSPSLEWSRSGSACSTRFACPDSLPNRPAWHVPRRQKPQGSSRCPLGPEAWLHRESTVHPAAYPTFRYVKVSTNAFTNHRRETKIILHLVECTYMSYLPFGQALPPRMLHDQTAGRLTLNTQMKRFKRYRIQYTFSTRCT